MLVSAVLIHLGHLTNSPYPACLNGNLTKTIQNEPCAGTRTIISLRTKPNPFI
jgi:hypothetical protein